MLRNHPLIHERSGDKGNREPTVNPNDRTSRLHFEESVNAARSARLLVDLLKKSRLSLFGSHAKAGGKGQSLCP